MSNYTVNGVPLFGASRGATPAARRGMPSPAVRALLDLTLWAERVFGLPLQHRLLDVLLYIGSSGRAPSAAEVSGAMGLPQADVAALFEELQRQGLMERAKGEGDGEGEAAGAGLQATPKLDQALDEFHALLERAFVSRDALRGSLLLNATRHADVAQRVERLFDRFFDLGWLYLHNWSATCHVMAELVAQALQQQGLCTRIVSGEAASHHEGRTLTLGRKGQADPGQFDGHVFCIVDERVLVDFGLGNVRRLTQSRFRRSMKAGLRKIFSRPTLCSRRMPMAASCFR